MHSKMPPYAVGLDKTVDALMAEARKEPAGAIADMLDALASLFDARMFIAASNGHEERAEAYEEARDEVRSLVRQLRE